jgi:hypothetical protein
LSSVAPSTPRCICGDNWVLLLREQITRLVGSPPSDVAAPACLARPPLSARRSNVKTLQPTSRNHPGFVRRDRVRREQNCRTIGHRPAIVLKSQGAHNRSPQDVESIFVDCFGPGIGPKAVRLIIVPTIFPRASRAGRRTFAFSSPSLFNTSTRAYAPRGIRFRRVQMPPSAAHRCRDRSVTSRQSGHRASLPIRPAARTARLRTFAWYRQAVFQ